MEPTSAKIVHQKHETIETTCAFMLLMQNSHPPSEPRRSNRDSNRDSNSPPVSALHWKVLNDIVIAAGTGDCSFLVLLGLSSAFDT